MAEMMPTPQIRTILSPLGVLGVLHHKNRGRASLAPEKGEAPVDQVIPLLMGQKVVESQYGLSVDLQEKLRQEGKFAPWMKIGRRVFYVRTEFERWLDEQKVKSMAGRGGAGNED
jgi:hypothetical protein